MKQLVSIYKSAKKDEMYLYVRKSEKFSRVPDALMQIFGRADHVVDMLLTEDRKMARVDAGKVLAELEEKGFYLQMPPARDDYMLDLYKDTSHRYEGL
ncbi:hypothetical protein YC6258_04136 [Gynuella sunshinyii YC6258]|uniref:YcgL domain-containing protein YC6258_04136 n=1 Tax=Gynuella sunshinyii YC6258 TaxID=1445510 RepID=A0A0C5VN84_9GAMM|nr:YcgL domain-containing protein [Gynuella sunshinyii]AJQ96172.1 hypothetical protein YC6258_04136 [Gynuella sunshinyii YC6258]